jgi:hypothetical protein
MPAYGAPRCANLITMAAWPDQFTLSNDLTEVTWIDLDPWVDNENTTVTSVIPRDFAAYVRVFHPPPSSSGFQRWSEVARDSGRTMHPLVQWKRISLDASGGSNPPEGEPQLEVLIPLVSTIRDFTQDPSRCSFAIWDGWGQLHTGSLVSFRFPGQPREVPTPVEQFVAEREAEARGYPRFELEPGTGRPYLLGTGPLEVVLEMASGSVYERPGVPVSMWWPTDHSWFVSSEIDFDSTVIGGSAELCSALLANEELEALEVPPDGILDESGDTIN